jgi:hypothetical protein
MKLISKLLLSAAFLVAGKAGFAQSPGEIHEATYTITTRNLQGFSSIRLQGPFNVYIRQGNEESVKLDAPEEILGRIITEVYGGELNIHNAHDYWGDGFKSWYGQKSWWSTHKRVSVYITVKNLERLSVSGSGGVFFSGGLTAASLHLRLVGSGKMEGKVDVKKLLATMSGSGHITLAGTAGSSTVHISGSGNFAGRDLVTVSSAVHVSGSGHAEVNATENIDAALSGSAHVSYTGTAKLSTSKSGSGGVSRL